MQDYEFQVPPTNSTMAIVSLIGSIAGLTVFPLIGSIVGIITGFMAKKEIKESMGSIGGEGLATGGIIVGFIGLGIWLVVCCIIVFSFLLPFLMVGGLGLAGELFLIGII